MTIRAIIGLTNVVFSLIGLVLVLIQSKRPYSRAIKNSIIAVGVMIVIMSTMLLLGHLCSIAYWINALWWVVIIVLNIVE